MFCGQCGSQLPDNSRFCGNCGAVVSGAPPQPSPPPASSQGGYPYAGAGTSATPAPSYPSSPQPYGPTAQPYASQAPYPSQYAPQAPPQYSPPAAPYPAGQAYPPPAAPAAAYAQPQRQAYAQPAGVSPGAGPMPPQMHWLLVLVLSWVTFGLGGLIWAFKQAGFVKKIDPASKAISMLGLTVAVMAIQVLLYFTAMSSRSMSLMAAMGALTMLLNVVILIAALVAVFGMRRSLLNYYNSVEPIGLKLSPVMTFFFSILYFQYHFSRIGEWKRTGVLR